MTGKFQVEDFFQKEREFWDEGYDFVIGVDEAGRGPLAGPVVACAVGFFGSSTPTVGVELPKIKDSKKLSENQREKLFDFILENFHTGIGICDHETIDRINVLEATYLAMKKAISSLSRNMKNKTGSGKQIILVDGNKIIPNLSMEQRAIVGGDKTVKSISAASIIAKVTRDRIMKKMHDKYPEYGFLKHKGYGTAFHREVIRKHGPCEIHRRSFRLV